MSYSALRFESHPLVLHDYVKLWGKKRAYWHLRSLGATRYQALRAIFFAV
jgi:3-mercaptopyruvate sulfurtransferase SseA